MKRMIMAVLVSTSITLSAPAQAQMMPQVVCAARADVMSNLQGKFSEAPVAIGLANTGGVVEVLTSPDGGTWTIIVTDPNGMSCLMAAGEFWAAARKTLIGQRS